LKKNIPLSRPDITQIEVKKIVKTLSTSFLSRGLAVPDFEKRFKKYIGRKYAIAVNSGTSALHLIIRALGLKQGDEVITTPFSFIASANCLLYERIRPVFVDIDPQSLNINPENIEGAITSKTKAILAVDVFGHPAAWDALNKISKRYRLHIIEDSCEALGSEYKGKKAGSFGIASTFAFYPNKQMTTAEGGMIVTDDNKIAQLCCCLRNQGENKKGDYLEYPLLGYSYRLSDIHAALGLAQLGRLKQLLKKRSLAAQMYNQHLKTIETIEIPFVAKQVKMGWFVYIIRLKKTYGLKERDKIVFSLRKNGIMCRKYFVPIHLQPFYKETFGYKEGDFPIAESVSSRTIALPFYPRMGIKIVKFVSNNLRKALRSI